jgi:hypothetical protein
MRDLEVKRKRCRVLQTDETEGGSRDQSKNIPDAANAVKRCEISRPQPKMQSAANALKRCKML